MDAGHLMHSSYMEHGYCLNWEPPLLWLHVGSDIITGISYYSIPLAMFYFAYQRRDIPFFKIFIMFALFILSCGTTHLFSAYTIYVPDYWTEGYVKGVTALISALTAIVLIPRIPEAIALPSAIDTLDEIKALNGELKAKNTELQLANFSIQNILDPIYWISEDARILRVNDAACKSLGYTAEEMLGFTIFDLDPFFPMQRWPEHWSELKARKSIMLETRHRTKTGQLQDIEVSANYICYEGQEFNCAIVRDITLRKRVEKELRANERRMAGLYTLSQDQFGSEPKLLDHALKEAISLTDSKVGFVYFYNEQSRQFTLSNWSSGAMPEPAREGKKIFYTLDSIGIWREVLQKKPLLLNDLQAQVTAQRDLPEGQAGLRRLLAVPIIVDEAIVAVVGVADKEEDYSDIEVSQLRQFTDSVWMITLRKRAEDDRFKLEKQLLHAQKLESLGVLAGGIAHDFNNILVAILGNADLAIMKLPPESPVMENLRSIEGSVARAADLAKQMLAYSGKGKFIVEAIDLDTLLEEMLHMLQVSISKKAVLRFNPCRNLPTVEADATQLRQVIMNLVINASEAIGDRSGVIAIHTGYMDCDRLYLEEVWMDCSITEGTYVYLEVSDTGCGMDGETLSKIFDPFFTTKFTGRGLGMAAVMGIVRGHKGSIKVYSEVGKGTTFKLLFPASGRVVERSDIEEVGGVWRGHGKVLLVDDEETVRATGSKMLRELGYEVLTAEDGREAIETFKANSGISFVLLDLTMPHLDGEQCFRELRRLDPQVKVIMSSGYNEHDVTSRFLGKGLGGFIQKPYKFSDLKRVVMGLEK
jgi:two-component system, cell cycle sensor histidine kinase and response regulator CckA